MLGQRESQFLAQGAVQLLARVRVVAQEEARVLPPLPDALAVVAEPRAGLLQQTVEHAQVEQVGLARNPFAENQVELRLPEGSGQLVLHHLGARVVADDAVAVLDGRHPADVHPHVGVEPQRPSARRGLRVAEHHSDLHPQLVDKNQAGLRLVDQRLQLPQRLRHQPRLQAHLRVAHVAFQLLPRHQRRHRVHHHHVHCAGLNQRLRNLQRFVAAVGLRHQQVVHIHAQLARVDSIQGVLGIDERRHPALLLRFGNHVQRQRGLAARLGTKNLYYAPARHATHAQRRIQRQAAGGNHCHRNQRRSLPQTHDGPFAEVLFNLRNRQIQVPLSLIRHRFALV